MKSFYIWKTLPPGKTSQIDKETKNWSQIFHLCQYNTYPREDGVSHRWWQSAAAKASVKG